jgi:oligopeptide transport system permease protein
MITFFAKSLLPGGPFLDEGVVNQEVTSAMESKYNLDKPIIEQFRIYLLQLTKLDFGVSLKMQINRPVLNIIKDTLPISLKLGVIALIWAIIIGLIFGCIAAYKEHTWIDNFVSFLSNIGLISPNFVIATVLLVIFAGGMFHVLPSMGIDHWNGYILPCFTLGLSPMSHIAKYTKSSMIDVLKQDYIKVAKAKGLSSSRIIFKHALKNVLIVVVTYIGHISAFILTGSLVVETIFNIPGLGRYFVQSITGRDYPLIMGTTIVLSVIVVIINFIVELIYMAIDPRVRAGVYR